ncbi:MAG: UDP-glucose--hexose-1-phosphate uridylyltransferase [Oscillospiraceae bacterium]|nr:UDP-glucose--hexose-1-phosphate uridylyltransferase [Oscillospiraceae bacterium]
MIYMTIDNLIGYGINNKLLQREDAVFARNRVLELMRLPDYEVSSETVPTAPDLHDILSELNDYAVQNGLCKDSLASRERLSTAFMGILTPPPSFVIDKFRRLYSKSPEAATDDFYSFCQACNYIDRFYSSLDIRWQTETPFGRFDITINLSKPEKDPRDIAAAGAAPESGYPACLLCAENEGYAGRANHPARQNLRIIPIDIDGEDWGFQYSPYVYYNEHCIVLNKIHTPMIIDRKVFVKLLSFVKQFPHYFVGSNADLPIVGGSILSHEHFQGGRYEFPIERAPIEKSFRITGFEDIEAGIVKWPLSVIRISHRNPGRVVDIADYILNQWRGYSDSAVGVFACTGGSRHNTITPIARMRGNRYEFDLALRNNITSKAHPLGVFHPHAEIHNIKKENIGLIEVMGLAVLPSRLKTEMDDLKAVLLEKRDISGIDNIAKHAAWVTSWHDKRSFTPETADDILRGEIGNTFVSVLVHCGVFKRDEAGKKAFERFVRSIGGLFVDA